MIFHNFTSVIIGKLLAEKGLYLSFSRIRNFSGILNLFPIRYAKNVIVSYRTAAVPEE